MVQAHQRLESTQPVWRNATYLGRGAISLFPQLQRPTTFQSARCIVGEHARAPPQKKSRVHVSTPELYHEYRTSVAGSGDVGRAEDVGDRVPDPPQPMGQSCEFHTGEDEYLVCAECVESAAGPLWTWWQCVVWGAQQLDMCRGLNV